MASDLQLLFSYLSCYPDLMRATSDEASPTPGYLLHKIAGLMDSSPEQIPKLVDFMITRLQNTSSPTVKLKTLRLMLYCCRHGAPEFRRLLRRRDGDVTAGSAASGPPDPVLGMTPHLWVHSTSQELLALLFSDDVSSAPPRQLTGLGSAGAVRGGQYQGFGVSTPPRSGLTARVRGLVEDVLSPPEPAPDGAASLATSSGEYQPPPRLSAAVSGPEAPGPLLPAPARPRPRPPAAPPARGHIPGRAGGGWEDSDEEEADFDDVSVGSDVAAAIAESEEVSARPPASREVLEVRRFCGAEQGPVLGLSRAMELADRLAASGGRDVPAALSEQLSLTCDVTRLRALVLLDCLLQAWLPAGDGGAALAEAVAALAAADSEPVRTKAGKLARILDRLTATV